MLAVSLAVAFAALAAVEVVRCAGVPRLGAAVQRFMQVGATQQDLCELGALCCCHCRCVQQLAHTCKALAGPL